MKKFLATVAIAAFGLAGAAAANALPTQTDFADAGLQEIGSYFGKISWSIDGSSDAYHVVGDAQPIQVEKPAGATVREAIFISGDGGNRNSNNHPPQDLTLNGQSIVFSHWAYITSGDMFQTYYGDVTDIVKSTIDSHAAGTFDLAFDQGDDSDGDYVEGGALIVIFDDPNAPLSSIYLNAGTSLSSGDTFTVDFPALTADNLNNDIIMSVGSSNSYQWNAWQQSSEVTINGDYLTTVAGGCDDSLEFENGEQCAPHGYNTIGGVGDTPSVPGYVDTEVVSYTANYDNELYLLNSFLAVGDTAMEVYTRNPSTDDNLYFAGIYMRGILPTATYCDDHHDECFPNDTSGGLASTGATGVDTITLVGGGLILAGVAIAVYRIVSRRKAKPADADKSAE